MMQTMSIKILYVLFLLNGKSSSETWHFQNLSRLSLGLFNTQGMFCSLTEIRTVWKAGIDTVVISLCIHSHLLLSDLDIGINFSWVTPKLNDCKKKKKKVLHNNAYLNF